jgi:hypothetical protein
MMPMLPRFLFLALTLAAAGCGSGGGNGNGVSSGDDAQRAYEGLDASIDKAITLGFAGFNAASSANIPPQMAAGTKSGTMTIGGQVDQGASSNKTMNLTESLVMYSDDGMLVYDTHSSAALSMKLSMIPTGTLSGTLAGDFVLSGQLQGTVTLNLQLSGDLEPVAGSSTQVQRKPGTTHVTGTATSNFGVYPVDVTR